MTLWRTISSKRTTPPPFRTKIPTEVKLKKDNRWLSILGGVTLSSMGLMAKTYGEEDGTTVKQREENNESSEVNPFSYDTPVVTWYERIKLIFGAIFLAPTRIILLIPTVISLICTAKLAVLGLDEESKSKPLAWWRRLLFYQTRVLVRLILFILGFVWIRREGKLSEASVAPIIVSNHSSFIDPMIYYYEAFPTSVAKAEIAKTPIIGDVLSYICILVDRRDRSSRDATVRKIEERAREATVTDRQVLIFPEGTTTNGNALISFKTGAFHPGLPVQPVALHYSHRHYNPAWVPAGPTLSHLLLRMLCQFYNSVTVSYLEPYTPDEREKKDPLLFAHNVRSKIAERLNVSWTEHTYEDVMLMTLALQMHIPKEEASHVELNRIKSMYNVDFNDAKKLLEKFSKTSKKGRMDYEGFCRSLNLSENEFTEQLFSTIDTDGSGSINFGEFAVGLAAMSQRVDFQDTIRLAFEALDMDGNGRIDLWEMKSVLKRYFTNMDDQQVEHLFIQMASKEEPHIIKKAQFEAFAAENPEYVQLVANVATKRTTGYRSFQ